MEKTDPSSHFHTLVCRHQTACAIAMKACPGLRSGIDRSGPPIRHSGGGRNPEGWGEGVVALELVPSLGRTARSRKLQRPTDHHFHTLVCRRKPACAIAMKACPGLRSGIDRSGSLSFAIRGIPSSFRPPIRHSGEGRNPGGVGRGKATRRWKKPTRRPTFIPWCARASRHERLVRNGEKAPAQLPKRRREPTHRKTRQRRALAQDVVIGCVLERTGKGSTVQAIRSHSRVSIDTFHVPVFDCRANDSPSRRGPVPSRTVRRRPTHERPPVCTAQCVPLSETREDLDR